ncbi:radical SAM protein [Kibdelosporangium lantanae]|uniref:Radical SAM protein n=1 Tax=Kibdelosporangium lantanae TaxID=1497396 RepID=A0ABW3M1R1_9PSEU
MRHLTDPVAGGTVCYLSLQNPCNASCPMCLSWRDNSTLQGLPVAELIRELARQHWDTIMFTGGEFVTFPGAAELLAVVQELRMNIGFITNGTALTSQYRALLARLQIRKVILSRDFPDAGQHAQWRQLPEFSDADIRDVLTRLADDGTYVQVNTVLMPSNADRLADFPDVEFWPVVDAWHLIPVKGPIARGWSDALRAAARRALDSLRVNGLTYFVVGPSFFHAPIEDVRASRPTEQAVRGRTCQVERSQIYVDASGEVLPCNSIAWECRKTVGFGNLNNTAPADILRRRALALATNHNAARVGCHACDPLNMLHNDIVSGQ